MQNLQQMETNPDSPLLDMQHLHSEDGSPLSLGCQLRWSEEPSSILPFYIIYDGKNSIIKVDWRLVVYVEIMVLLLRALLQWQFL